MSRSAYQKHTLLCLGALCALLPGTEHMVAMGAETAFATYKRLDRTMAVAYGESEVLALAALLQEEAERSIRPERAREFAAGMVEEDARLRGAEARL